MELSRKQFDFLVNSDARINIAEGSVRSGKTFIFGIRFLDYIKSGPKGNLMMAGKTIGSLERNVLLAEKGLFDLLGEGNFRYNRSKGEIYLPDRKIFVFGANDQSSVSKIQGLTVAGSLADEVTLFPENFTSMMVTRNSVPGSKLFWNCNPDSPYHFIKKSYIDNPKLKDIVKVFHFIMDDNPGLDPQYISDLKAMYSGLFYQRFIEGLWVLAEGTIYDMFSEDIHVKQVEEDFSGYFISVDYGTQNPTVFELWGRTSNGGYHLIKEYFYNGREEQRQKTDKEYADDMVSFIGDIPIDYIIADPSAASFIAQLRQYNLKVMPAKNNVLDGIRTVSTYLMDEKLTIDPSCKNTIREFGAYIWDSKSIEIGKDAPLKDNDHCQDALRYAIFTDSHIKGGRKSFYNRTRR
jgi:PBSX family phage terminase large subunit